MSLAFSEQVALKMGWIRWQCEMVEGWFWTPPGRPNLEDGVAGPPDYVEASRQLGVKDPERQWAGIAERGPLKPRNPK